MSRSVHHTRKSVLGGKSTGQIDAMIEGADPDLTELAKKAKYKRRTRRERAERQASLDDEQL